MTLGSKKRKARKGPFNGFGRGALHAGGQFAIIDGTRLAAEDDGGV